MGRRARLPSLGLLRRYLNRAGEPSGRRSSEARTVPAAETATGRCSVVKPQLMARGTSSLGDELPPTRNRESYCLRRRTASIACHVSSSNWMRLPGINSAHARTRTGKECSTSRRQIGLRSEAKASYGSQAPPRPRLIPVSIATMATMTFTAITAEAQQGMDDAALGNPLTFQTLARVRHQR